MRCLEIPLRNLLDPLSNMLNLDCSHLTRDRDREESQSVDRGQGIPNALWIIFIAPKEIQMMAAHGDHQGHH
jgi:hypothetical protein